MMRYSLLSLSLGRYFFGSFIITAFLGLGLFFCLSGALRAALWK